MVNDSQMGYLPGQGQLQVATSWMHHVRMIRFAALDRGSNENLLSQSSKKQLENLKVDFSSPDEIDGYDEIP